MLKINGVSVKSPKTFSVDIEDLDGDSIALLNLSLTTYTNVTYFSIKFILSPSHLTLPSDQL